MERLKPATELKLVSRGNEFHAFTTRSLKKIDLAQVLLRLLNKQSSKNNSHDVVGHRLCWSHIAYIT